MSGPPVRRRTFSRFFGKQPPLECGGGDVTDAHIATLMRQHGVGTIYTRDRDFRRFDGIRVEDPFAAAA